LRLEIILLLFLVFYCPWYSISKGEEIKQIVIKKLNSIGVLRKACDVVIGVEERILKITTLKR